MKTKTILILLFFIFLLPQNSYAQDSKLYYKAIDLARHKQIDFAFSYFDMIVNTYPKSKFYENSLFAVGEYYFLSGDTLNAKKTFESFLIFFPESKAKPFVLVYLLRIAEQKKDKNSADNFKKEIISSKQVSLVFRDFQEYKYTSALNKNYKALYFIDRVEIYIDGELSTKIPF